VRIISTCMYSDISVGEIEFGEVMDFSKDFSDNGQNILVEHYEDDFEPTTEGKRPFHVLIRA